MSLRAFIPIVLVGVGLPAFIMYSIFLSGPKPRAKTLQNYEHYKEAVTALSSERYEVLSVSDEGGTLRVDVWSRGLAPSSGDSRVQTLNTLYDIQSLVGSDVSVSVWSYASPDISRQSLVGLAFYRAVTGQTVYKDARELR